MKTSFNRNVLAAAVALLSIVAIGVTVWTARPAVAAENQTAQARSVLTVNVVTPQTEAWPDVVQGSGQVAAWQEVVVSPETGGLRIAELLVDVGSSVKRGQLLARLSDESVQADLRKQAAAVDRARVVLDQAESNLKRAKLVESSGALSGQKVEDYRISEATARADLASAEAELDSIRLKLRQTRIVAADDGIVSSKSAVLGNVASAGSEMFRLIRQGRLEWRPEFDARQTSMLQVGQKAQVVLPTGKKAEGRVRLVSPTLSASTGRATVFVSLPVDGPARMGMFASGSVELDSRPAQTLPQSAVTLRDGRAYIYLVGTDSKVSSRVVTTGRRQGGRVEVDGVPANARVVADGGAFLSDGAQVTVAAAAAGASKAGVTQ